MKTTRNIVICLLSIAAVVMAYFCVTSVTTPIKFENTRNILRCILRLVLGVGVYFGLSTLTKLPFNKDFLNAATMASYAVRAVRYCVIIFVTIGVYPLLFRLGDRVFKRKDLMK